MKRFFLSLVILLIIAATAMVTWAGLDDQARGMVVGILLGIAGLAAGMILAFAVVGVFLLIQLRWSVQTSSSKPAPMRFLSSRPALPPPPVQHAPYWRQPRVWQDVVGAEDVVEGDFTS